MKYVKFSLVDVDTGISVLRKPVGKNGSRNPDIEGLEELFTHFRMPEWHFGTASDNAVLDPNNENYEITIEELKENVKDCIVNAIEEYKIKLPEIEKEARDVLLSKYHSTAIIAGNYKYDEAVAYLANNAISVPTLELEANTRGVTVSVLAQRIKTNHEAFRDTDAKIAGLRGMIQKRYDDYVFDETKDAMESYNDFFNKGEKVGERTIGELSDEPRNLDVMINYYYPNILDRYK